MSSIEKRLKTENNNQVLNELQTYSKDSFDRFGDDLSEVVLQYLTFEEKKRLECVSKQFQRCVYEKQYELSIDWKLENRLTTIESILRNCRNVNKIVFNNNNIDLLLYLVINYCPKLTQIDCDFYNTSEETIDELFHRFATKLKTIKSLNSYVLKAKLKLCTKLVELNMNDNSLIALSEGSIDSMNKLSKISFTYSKECMNRFEYFVNKHKNSLKSIEVNVNQSVSEEAINCLMNGLKQMSQLIDLKLCFSSNSNNKLFTEGLTQIGLKCCQLKCLRLSCDSTLSETHFLRIIKAINHNFKRINRLELNIGDISGVGIALLSESLSECKQLTHLTLEFTQNYNFNDLFFIDIEKRFPKLEYLSISNAKITDSAINSLTKHLKLQTIYFHSTQRPISDSSVYELFNKCNEIQKVFINGKYY